MRNVHKIDTRLIAIPREAQQDDCGLKYCESIQTVLSSQSETTNWKNDRTSFAFKFDSISVKLIKDGIETDAVGYDFTFPKQEDAVGFVIDWRQNPYGCFKIKIEWELGGLSGWFWYAKVRHLPWNCDTSRNTVRLFIHLDDFVRKQGINYKGSGFYGTVRFNGIFGYMQPNYDTENIIYSDRQRHKVRIEAVRSYEMHTDQLTYSMTRLIDEDVLLCANSILVTDHSEVNHNQDIKDFPVILSESESPQFEYSDGLTASIKAVFNEKVAVSESRYSSDINATLPVVQTVVSGNTINLTVNSEPFLTGLTGNTNIGLVDQDGNDLDFTVDGSDLVVEVGGSTEFDVVLNVNGILVDTFTLDASVDNTININA